MVTKKWIGFALIILAVSSLVSGCGRERPKSDFELGKEHFLASDYAQAMVRLEKWVRDSKNPNLVEAYAMLAVIYHDYENRGPQFEATLSKLKEIGEPGMAAVFKIMENPTGASRLGNTISDILVKGGKLSVGPLLSYLRGPNWRLKKSAQEVLIKIGEPAVEPLMATLNDPDTYTRGMAIEALSKIGDKRATGLLEQKLNDPDKFVRITAAAALHSLGNMNPQKVIIDGLEDPDVKVRYAAAKAVSEYIDNPPLASMLKLMKDPDPDIRNYATISVGKTRNPEVVPSLVRAIKEDTSEQVRNSAAKALEGIGTPSVAPLIELLEGAKDMELIIRVAQILGNIGDKRAVEPLENVYKKDNRPMVKNEVAKALNKID